MIWGALPRPRNQCHGRTGSRPRVPNSRGEASRRARLDPGPERRRSMRWPMGSPRPWSPGGMHRRTLQIDDRDLPSTPRCLGVDRAQRPDARSSVDFRPRPTDRRIDPGPPPGVSIPMSEDVERVRPDRVGPNRRRYAAPDVSSAAVSDARLFLVPLILERGADECGEEGVGSIGTG